MMVVTRHYIEGASIDVKSGEDITQLPVEPRAVEKQAFSAQALEGAD
jgi:hypothetical protein